MSTINKTFLRVLLAIACCIALAFSLLPQAEAAMRADIVIGKVTLNGQVIDNKESFGLGPVVANNMLYTLDTKGRITAYR